MACGSDNRCGRPSSLHTWPRPRSRIRASSSSASTGTQRDPDARGDVDLGAGELERLGEARDDLAARRFPRLRPAARLVSTTANSSPPRRPTVVAAPHGAHEPLGGLLQQLVAFGVPERVVHVLETIEVDEHDSGRPLVHARVVERFAQACSPNDARFGSRVSASKCASCSSCCSILLAVGDVAVEADDADDVAVRVGQRDLGARDPALVALAVRRVMRSRSSTGTPDSMTSRSSASIRIAILRREDVEDCFSQQLLRDRRRRGLLRSRRSEAGSGPAVFRVDALGYRVDDGPEQRALDRDGFLRALALRDVLHHADEVARRADASRTSDIVRYTQSGVPSLRIRRRSEE